MHNASKNCGKQESYTDDIEALKAVLAEAEDLLAEYAIEMRRRAGKARLRVQQLTEELGD